ncbi:hypothetical protein CFIO01_00035 [Colletotrichum fioriniae PJ7]|uniref:Uncharacterized protein n=1 Tax=Colletotrichum fioriniae PJ7 TaxID=1445577 RepID=A0A010SN47_9PEZI|nr:hypothetical protein CFIO01_00035 [Colletotrichum fioriniae PJ7]
MEVLRKPASSNETYQFPRVTRCQSRTTASHHIPLTPPRDSSSDIRQLNEKDKADIKHPTNWSELPENVVHRIVGAVLENYGDEVAYGYDAVEDQWQPVESAKFERFSVWRDVTHLARTCKRYSELVTPVLFDYDIANNYASSLLLSAKKGHYFGVAKSLRYGADANMKDHTEFTIDHTPYEETYQQTSRCPLETNLTALHWAAFNRDEKSLALLLQHGADVSLRTDIWARRPSTTIGDKFACQAYNLAYLSFAPTLKAIPSSEYSLGVLSERLRLGANALYFAFAFAADDQEGSYTRTVTSVPVRAVMDLLIAAGASLTTHESTQLNALHQAGANWDAAAVSLLLTTYKVDPNVRDAFGNTPLHHFAANRLKDRRNPEHVIEVLTDHGADLRALNASGMTPIDLAKKYRQNESVIASMRHASAKPLPESVQGHPLVAGAIARGHQRHSGLAVPALNYEAFHGDEIEDAVCKVSWARKREESINKWLHLLYIAWLYEEEDDEEFDINVLARDSEGWTPDEWRTYWAQC